MRTTALALALTFLWTSTAAAQIVVRDHDPEAAARTVLPADQTPDVPSSGIIGAKLDEPTNALVVPFYQVDTTSGSGTTTLFAVRNITDETVGLDVRYLSPEGDILREDPYSLVAEQTLTVNVRDVGGLSVDPDGFARGYVGLIVTTTEPTDQVLVGDYLQVDVANNFATGERMVSLSDFCQEQEIRFLDFGEDTSLRFLILTPRGTEPGVSPPSFRVDTYRQDGTLVTTSSVFAGAYSFELPASIFTAESFGTFVFDFSNAGGGAVYAEYSAGGRFSVGINGACTMQ